MTPLPLRDLVSRLKSAGRACTLLGVGPVSETVVRATFQACARHRCPAIFIASRNQVDLVDLGHGYLMGGMDQRAFVELLQRSATEAGYGGPLYICRDHGGPWQRNAELDGRYDLDRAMAVARRSFQADIEAGFNYLHIDPTKCPHPHTQDDLVAWTADLVAFCETARCDAGRGEIDYEVGTEDIQGGLTTPETFEAFLRKLTDRLASEGLPPPTCVVGQTGTLCREDRNVGCFDAEGTRRLAQIAARYGIGLKEHNGDYLSAVSCRVHPELGVTGMNVAPEFGLVETDALLALADLEAKLVREGWLADAAASHLRQILLERTFAASPWKKWMTDDVRKLPPDRIATDAATRLLIARVCGHYVYDDPAVKAARAVLCSNLAAFHMIEEPDASGTGFGGTGVPPVSSTGRRPVPPGEQPEADAFILARVRAAIEFYICHFALEGVNTLL